MYASLHMPGGGGASGSSFTALGSSARSASSLARAIRAEEYSLRNRIKSLIDDRAFVATVRRDYPSLPLFANLRCGVWYVESCSSSVAGDASAAASPAAASSGGNGTAAEACYFKSTDGHAHHWKFSAARLNVHVLQRIIQHAQSGANSADGGEATVAVASPRCSGALFVDSTRKGKRFPDSFSRTMPIWCAVWNRALLEVRQRAANATAAAGADSPDTSASDAAWDTALHMPLWVSDMEKRQIEERLPGFVATLLSSGVDLEPIARGLLKPLRCLWVDRNSPGWANGEQDLAALPFTPLLLVQCSRVESETRGIGQRQGWSYIQGAGDDEENWQGVAGIAGFTPDHLTRYQRQLLQLDHDDEIVECIREIVHDEQVQRAHAQAGKTGTDPSSLLLHRVPCGPHTILASTALPSCAAATAAAAVDATSPSPLSLLYLYFDNTLQVKQQRKAKLALEQQRAHRTAGDDDPAEEEDDDAAQQLSSLSLQTAPSVDLLDWPADAALALPLSSASKSRTSLLDVLAPGVDFIRAQIALQRTVLVACEDGRPRTALPRLPRTARKHRRHLSYVSCICAAAVVSTAAATPSAPSSFPSSPSAVIDKNLLRSTLTSVKCHLPQHFPSRLLLKQLNVFFLNCRGT